MLQFYILHIKHLFFEAVKLKMPKYAVAKGKKRGIFDTWEECKQQVTGFRGAKYKKFDSMYAAEEYMREHAPDVATTNVEQRSKIVPDPTSIAISDPVSLAIKNHSENAFPIARVSPAETSLNEINKKIQVLESKFLLFSDSVNLKFDNILKRLAVLESRALGPPGSSNGVTTVDLTKNDDQQPTASGSTPKKRKADSDESEEAAHLGKCNIVDEVDGYSDGWLRHYVPDASGFLISPDGVVIVYTDGACTNNGRQGAKAGIGVWFNHQHPLNVSAPVRGRPTNNNAEIQAATEAIRQASKAGVRRLHIFTDSQFLINCITGWIYKWKRNDWVTADGKPVKNKIELVELDQCIQTMMDSVMWTHVKGHAGDVGNTQADLLARLGAEMNALN
ncbi:ribonuclease H1 isoform X2 [Nilaparvata lugens]|uniref:ribonuclease H1 isoform X1 n=1 Tax=Nilaparvata lugens TaxID=108931 RepID=UPI00193C8CB2|nr:ribonuclease H1 isoform X1 [Nilaparvata lugens]XP_039282111.1 ribonuclease H1 isoform X2 [Nilaparvata lugens]